MPLQAGQRRPLRLPPATATATRWRLSGGRSPRTFELSMCGTTSRASWPCAWTWIPPTVERCTRRGTPPGSNRRRRPIAMARRRRCLCRWRSKYEWSTVAILSLRTSPCPRSGLGSSTATASCSVCARRATARFSSAGRGWRRSGATRSSSQLGVPATWGAHATITCRSLWASPGSFRRSMSIIMCPKRLTFCPKSLACATWRASSPSVAIESRAIGI
mmetsp:Transcript_13824/g.39815  ORF Transcript_13824/g.39815 Transcript_13824/m.39815 type:complete len:218 (+) Transcript_13824:465-1118(+)